MKLNEFHQSCPECGGPVFTDLILAEKKDACYYKVKSSAKVWPSAYASGRLVQCRKKGADNYGNKSEGVAEGWKTGAAVGGTLGALAAGPVGAAVGAGIGGFTQSVYQQAKQELDKEYAQRDKEHVLKTSERVAQLKVFVEDWTKFLDELTLFIYRESGGVVTGPDENGNYQASDYRLWSKLDAIQSHYTDEIYRISSNTESFEEKFNDIKQYGELAEKELRKLGNSSANNKQTASPEWSAKRGRQDLSNESVEQGVAEEWSQKYKSSINCSHPKGFSQRAHCAGKKKHTESVEMEMVCEDCGMCETHVGHENLDEACWKGYHKEGNKELFGKTVPNCVKNTNEEESMTETTDELARILELGGVKLDEELIQEFDLIESIIDQIAEHNDVDAEIVWTDLESLTEDELYAFAVTSQLNEDWQKANKKDRTAGMSQKAVNAYRRENPGSKLKTAVTTKPSKLKRGSKASKRRKSYCSRSRGQMKMHNISCAKTPDKAICKARRRWNC